MAAMQVLEILAGGRGFPLVNNNTIILYRVLNEEIAKNELI